MADKNSNKDKGGSTGKDSIGLIVDHTKKKSIRNDEPKKEQGGTPTTNSTGPGKTTDSNE